MGELDGMLSQILSSPEDMDKIMGLARELSGGQADKSETEKEEPKADMPLDPKLIGMITKLMGETKGKDEKTALIEALKPYVTEEHRGDLDRAAKMAKLVKLARFAMQEFGGDFGVL